MPFALALSWCFEKPLPTNNEKVTRRDASKIHFHRNHFLIHHGNYNQQFSPSKTFLMGIFFHKLLYISANSGCFRLPNLWASACYDNVYLFAASAQILSTFSLEHRRYLLSSVEGGGNSGRYPCCCFSRAKHVVTREEQRRSSNSSSSYIYPMLTSLFHLNLTFSLVITLIHDGHQHDEYLEYWKPFGTPEVSESSESCG